MSSMGGMIGGQISKTATNVSNNISKYKATKADASYQIAIYGSNMMLQEAATQMVIDKIEAQKKRVLSSQRVAIAKNGAMFSGSPARVAIETNKQFNLDVAAEKFNLGVERYKTNIKIREMEIRAYAAEYEAIAGNLGEVSKGFSSMSGMMSKFKGGGSSGGANYASGYSGYSSANYGGNYSLSTSPQYMNRIGI